MLVYEVVGVLWLGFKLILDLEVLAWVLEVVSIVNCDVHWEESVWHKVLVDLLGSNKHILLAHWGDELSILAIVGVVNRWGSVPLKLKITVVDWLLISELDEHVLTWNVSLDGLNGGGH